MPLSYSSSRGWQKLDRHQPIFWGWWPKPSEKISQLRHLRSALSSSMFVWLEDWYSSLHGSLRLRTWCSSDPHILGVPSSSSSARLTSKSLQPLTKARCFWIRRSKKVVLAMRNLIHILMGKSNPQTIILRKIPRPWTKTRILARSGNPWGQLSQSVDRTKRNSKQIEKS
jgi:hypothetical protein